MFSSLTKGSKTMNVIRSSKRLQCSVYTAVSMNMITAAAGGAASEGHGCAMSLHTHRGQPRPALVKTGSEGRCCITALSGGWLPS